MDTSADYFADSSAETVTENDFEEMEICTTQDILPAPIIDPIFRESFESSLDASMIDKFVTDSNLPSRICCPFCILDFGYEILLKDHIKQAHGREFKIVLESKPNDIDFHQCPFCQAKFYTRELLPRHVLRKHEMCVVNIFSGFSPEKYVYCRFCPHKIMRKHYKLLMIHIEKKHYPLFEKYIIDKYSNITKSFDDIIEMESKPVVYDTPGLSNDMLKLSTNQIEKSVKPILKSRTAYPLEKSECLSPEKGKTYANLSLPQQNLRRKLRFNLPDSPESKENVPLKRKNETNSKWSLKFKKIKKNPEDDTEPVSFTDLATQLCRFKCGLCSKAFDVNAKLLEHIKKKHKGFALQARYRCGECEAKFYKNDYLVKHCWHSHGPLCLKTPTYKKDSSVQF